MNEELPSLGARFRSLFGFRPLNILACLGALAIREWFGNVPATLAVFIFVALIERERIIAYLAGEDPPSAPDDKIAQE